MLAWLAVVVVFFAGCASGSSASPVEVPEMTQSLGNTDRTGDVTIGDRQTFSGQVAGTLTIARGGNVTLNGQVTGDLIVEVGGRVEILGMVLGDVINRGEVSVLGVVAGEIVDEGGTTTLISGASVNGADVP